MEEKICKNFGCLNKFTPKIEWQAYCSVRCRIAYNNKLATMKVINCPHCSGEIKLKEIKELTK